jgi:hypothetical protein
LIASRGVLVGADGDCNYALYEDADLALRAAALAHGVAESQTFIDGNKRLALIAMLTFLDTEEIIATVHSRRPHDVRHRRAPAIRRHQRERVSALPSVLLTPGEAEASASHPLAPRARPLRACGLPVGTVLLSVESGGLDRGRHEAPDAACAS